MTLDEAIKHAEEVAEEQDMKAGFETDYQTYIMSEEEREKCRECAEEHRQLAEWLKELKAYKEQSGDAISRQAVLEFIGKQIDHSLWAYEKLVNGIKDLPPVTPQQRTGRWIIKDGKEQAYERGKIVKESIPYIMHKEMDIPLLECQKAYDIAIDYLRSQGKVRG